jgi:hypothetical protein
MEKTLIILVLLFSSSVVADDISDFEIEGMSIGDSLLDYFTKDEIENKKKGGFVYSDKEFYSSTFHKKPQFELYDAVQFHLKNMDNKYIIYSIAGDVYYENNYDGCVKKLEEILPEIKEMFKNSKVIDGGTEIWKNAKGYDVKTKSYWVILPSMDEVSLECYDEHKKMNITDSLTISIDSKEFAEWLHSG